MSEELTRIIFSGVESQKAWDAVIGAGARNVLMSIHYLTQKGTKTIKKRLEQNPDVKIMIDSGAYTFLANQSKYKDKPISFWEKYIEDYIAWAREHKDMVFAIVELDLDDIVGTPQVEEWRKKYFEPLKAEGIEVIYVWHEVKGMQEWTRMCKKYDYVGLSFASDDHQESMAIKMMRTAQKYKAKVHGFAMTSIGMLTKVPFYTADSTTWLVGSQYGELNWFDGRKMTRLKKDKWKKMRSKFVALGANWDVLKSENTDEMNRVNVLSFLKAEEYVHRRLKNKMYWLSKKKKIVAKKKQRDVVPDEPAELIMQDVSDVDFPDLDTWDKRENLREISRLMNISPDYAEDDTIQANAVVDATVFLNQDKYENKLEEVYTDEIIAELTTQYLEEEILDREEAIGRLSNFFDSVVCGDNDFFYSHPFREDDSGDDSEEEVGEAAPRPKERDDYLVDDEMEEDLSMPEVEAYDQELMVVDDNKPVRNEQGKFLTGNKVRKPKNLYSEKFPKLACDTCYAAASCPEFRPGHVCAFQKMFNKFDSRDMHDVMEQMVSIVNMNASRVQRVAIFEMLDGGMPDAQLTGLMTQQMQWLNMLAQLRKQTTFASDGATVSMNIQGGEGILSKIFGVREEPKTVRKEDDIIDAEFEEIDDLQDGGDE